MRSALAKEVLKNHNAQTFLRTPTSNSTSPSSYASMKPSIHWEHTSFKKGSKPDDPPQDVDKFRPIVSSSTTTILNDTCPLHTSYEHPVHLDSPSLSSEPQDTSIVESTEPESITDSDDLPQLDCTSVTSQGTSSIEIECLAESEGQLGHANLPPTVVFLNTMTINCPYYKRRLMHHMII